ncbi:unnamed protein product [Protopolystoma xenopodis]|uniref:Uncharacterized protein n=1 Tax=Protopolystoma xenopodis TaxID=117903 RepID=A0A3S5FC65_9PLAT|nr:unnamed protein product [Protopolystoma xenopodis]
MRVYLESMLDHPVCLAGFVGLSGLIRVGQLVPPPLPPTLTTTSLFLPSGLSSGPQACNSGAVVASASASAVACSPAAITSVVSASPLLPGLSAGINSSNPGLVGTGSAGSPMSVSSSGVGLSTGTPGLTVSGLNSFGVSPPTSGSSTGTIITSGLCVNCMSSSNITGSPSGGLHGSVASGNSGSTSCSSQNNASTGGSGGLGVTGSSLAPLSSVAGTSNSGVSNNPAAASSTATGPQATGLVALSANITNSPSNQGTPSSISSGAPLPPPPPPPPPPAPQAATPTSSLTTTPPASSAVDPIVLDETRVHFCVFVRDLLRRMPESMQNNLLSPLIRHQLFLLFSQWSGHHEFVLGTHPAISEAGILAKASASSSSEGFLGLSRCDASLLSSSVDLHFRGTPPYRSAYPSAYYHTSSASTYLLPDDSATVSLDSGLDLITFASSYRRLLTSSSEALSTYSTEKQATMAIAALEQTAQLSGQ